jgi:transcriptional regulator with PAS, ATPase and Fis domain
VDVRVLAATNRNLSEDVASGKFREDLYYRLKVVELHCPALRDRLEDLPALAQHFIEHYSQKLGKPVLGISPSALKALEQYSWPGNIRELENMIVRAVALATTQVLGPEDFILFHPQSSKPLVMPNGDHSSMLDSLLTVCRMSSHDLRARGLAALLASCERICVQTFLEKSKNQKDAAEALGVTQTKLCRLIRRHGFTK